MKFILTHGYFYGLNIFATAKDVTGKMYSTRHSETLNAIRHLKHSRSRQKVLVTGHIGVGKTTLIKCLTSLKPFQKIIFEESSTLMNSDHFDIILPLPSFQDCPDDIDMLCREILGNRLSEENRAMLKSWHWPGEREELVTFLKAVGSVTEQDMIPLKVLEECKTLRPIILNVLPLAKEVYQLAQKFGFTETLEALSRVVLVRAMAFGNGRMNTAAESIRYPYHKFHYEIQKAPKIWKMLCKEWKNLEKTSL